MTFVRKLKRNKISVLFGVGILGCFLLNSREIQKNFFTIGQVRELSQINAAKDMQLRVSQQQIQMQAEIANERYQTGCVLVVSKQDPTTFTSLSEGQPVIDSKRQTPLPTGTVVCDANGNTGKIIPGSDGTPVVGEMAFTGNREVVEAARKSTQLNYVLPTNN
ncbi:hypothetical protein [Coleofasciculus sp. FACHB-64]|uniref:hypothetical protein n=1 Tax=Cyanophyceae TaxID=3028117 RepID=UPI0018EF78E8|nr:hypothetical protein [Coleofasciculus sp. FACHB-64]